MPLVRQTSPLLPRPDATVPLLWPDNHGLGGGGRRLPPPLGQRCSRLSPPLCCRRRYCLPPLLGCRRRRLSLLRLAAATSRFDGRRSRAQPPARPAPAGGHFRVSPNWTHELEDQCSSPTQDQRSSPAQDRALLEIRLTLLKLLKVWPPLLHSKCCSSHQDQLLHQLQDSEECAYVRENVLETIKLDAPNGCIYDIRVCREMGEIILRAGWDAFVAAYNIEENDSSFKVKIFSHDGSQNTTSSVNPPSEIFGAVPPGTSCDYHVPNGKDVPYPGHVHMSTGFDYSTPGGCRSTKVQDEKVLEMARTIRSEFPLYVAVMNKIHVNLKGCCISIPSVLLKSFRKEHGTYELDDLQASLKEKVNRNPLNLNNFEEPSWPPYIMSRRITLSGPQEKMVLAKVQAIRSKFPIFVAVMNRSNIGEKGFLLRFAAECGRRCLPLTTQGLTLQLEGSRCKEWHTVLHVQGGQSRSPWPEDCRWLAGLRLRQPPPVGRYLPLRTAQDHEKA